jgi:hypothetical protein
VLELAATSQISKRPGTFSETPNVDLELAIREWAITQNELFEPQTQAIEGAKPL